MAYCTVAQFTANYDSRRVCSLLSDSGSPVTVNDLDTNAVLIQLLEEASEEVAAAALVGKRYTTAQLTALGSSTTSGFLLRRLVSDITFALVVSRRGQGAADIERLCPRHREALRQLDLLRSGIEIFPGIDDTHAEAGLPASVNLLSTTNPNRRDTLTTQARRLFPPSCDRVPTGRCGC